MRNFDKDPTVISKLSPEQYRVTQAGRHRKARNGGVPAQQGARASTSTSSRASRCLLRLTN